MKNGYDQFFKTAQKIAAQNMEPARLKAPQPDFRANSNQAKNLTEKLRSRVRPTNKKKLRKSISWKLAGISLIGLLLAGVGLFKMEKIESFIRSIEISMLGSASAAETKEIPEAAGAKPSAKSAAKPDEKNESKAETATATKEFSSQEINHFSKLNERKRELDAREEELNRMEQELATQKGDIEKRLLELESNRKNISSVLQEKVQVDEKKVENLVQMYSNMKPQQSAKAFETMDEGLAIEILGRMKKKNAAEIMNLVKPEKVKILSEKYAGYKRN